MSERIETKLEADLHKIILKITLDDALSGTIATAIRDYLVDNFEDAIDYEETGEKK